MVDLVLFMDDTRCSGASSAPTMKKAVGRSKANFANEL
jgi:hypothetical protein